MKKPNITPGPWKTDRRFPASIIAGEPEETPHGLAADSICKVMGSALPNYKTNLQAIAALPDLLAALEGLILDKYLADPINADRMAPAKAALIKAGYTF